MQMPRMWKGKTMTQKEAFADLEKKLAALEKDLAQTDFSDLERQLQDIDLDFLLQ